MESDNRFNWSWGMRPATTEEFNRMMKSLDQHLADLLYEPNQRGLHAAVIVSNKLGLSGTPILGGNDNRGKPFSPADTLARVHEWYSETYGDKVLIDFSPGSVVLLLHGNLWRLKMPLIFGKVEVFLDPDLANAGNARPAFKGSSPASMNLLRSIQGLTQAYSSRLTRADLHAIMARFKASFDAIACLDGLQGHDLFEEARSDYRHSVDALLSGREFGKSRWDTAQCAEKVFKGMLARDTHGFPRSHDIVQLGRLVSTHFSLTFDANQLAAVNCSPAVRYGEVKTTRDEALAAHDSLLSALGVLAAAKAHYSHRTA